MVIFSSYKKEYPNLNDIEWVVPVEEFPYTGLRKSTLSHDKAYKFKSLIDVLFSVIALVLLFIPFIILGLAIKLTSKGPVFFKQERIGMDGKRFTIIKFRTMHRDAEALKTNLHSLNEASGPVFKIERDPRITKLGYFLRATGIDEMPQLWNVIMRDMSLIGPRPALESEVRQYEPQQMRRLAVKPGITCTWQIQPNRHRISFEEWMAYDLDYIDNWSVKKDIKIFIQSIKTVLQAGGH